MQSLVIWKSLALAYWDFLLEYKVRKLYYSNIQYILLIVKISLIYLNLNSLSPLLLSLMQIDVSLKENKFIVLLYIYFL